MEHMNENRWKNPGAAHRRCPRGIPIGKEHMSKILKLLKNHIPTVLICICLLCVQAWCELELPGLMSDIVDIGIVQGGVEDATQEYITQVALGQGDKDVQMAYLWSTGGKMALVALVTVLVAVTVNFMASRTAAQVGRDLRRDVFAKVLSFSHTEMEHFSTASLITRSTNDIQQVQMVIVMILRMVLFAPIMGIGGIIKVMNTGTGMGWIIVVAVVCVFALVMILMRITMPKFKKMQSLVDNVNLVSREILTGLPVIRAFHREKYEEQRFDKANAELRNTQLFTGRTMAFMGPGMTIIMNVVSVLIVWFGAKGVDLGDMAIGDMMAFMSYTMQIVMSFMMITMISIMVPRAAVSAERLDEILRTETVIREPEQETLPDPVKGCVTFDHVSFKYPGAEDYALKDITFTARPGETTAIIGSTGSGKSTLLNLIPRFYDVTEGQITLDGVDIREMQLHTLRDQLGYVPQKAVLFSGTIESNIKYAGGVSDEEMCQAAQIAQSTAFIEEKEGQYASCIAQGGSNVSGGQKQRLSIARAVASDPRVYLFDDSFSALDYKTDAQLRNALAQNAGDTAVIIVGQRIATVMHADNIIVLKDGIIDGMGTHEQLLKTCETYKEIAVSQLSAKELGMEV